jgi:hypothetical protein
MMIMPSAGSICLHFYWRALRAREDIDQFVSVVKHQSERLNQNDFPSSKLSAQCVTRNVMNCFDAGSWKKIPH